MLLAQLAAADDPPPLLHPSMADLYRSKVEELATALQREDTRLEASKMLRGLTEAIVLTPQDGQLRIELGIWPRWLLPSGGGGRDRAAAVGGDCAALPQGRILPPLRCARP